MRYVVYFFSKVSDTVVCEFHTKARTVKNWKYYTLYGYLVTNYFGSSQPVNPDVSLDYLRADKHESAASVWTNVHHGQFVRDDMEKNSIIWTDVLGYAVYVQLHLVGIAIGD